MKSLRLLMCVMPLALAGCSTMSSVNWSAANPWNWFGSSDEVTEQGVAGLTGSTPLKEEAISEALDGHYHLRSGMKTDNGNIVRFFEALKDNKVALVINGEGDTVSQVDIQDPDIKTAGGGQIGSVFSDLYGKAYGNCHKASGDNSGGVECKAEGSQHISYLFTGQWSGPADLMPSDDALKSWKVSKIIWRR